MHVNIIMMLINLYTIRRKMVGTHYTCKDTLTFNLMKSQDVFENILKWEICTLSQDILFIDSLVV